MRKLIFIVLLLSALLVTVALASFTLTPNFGLSKPDYGHSGWWALLNGDMDIIDTQMGRLRVIGSSSVTIASDVLTITASTWHKVDTEGAAASDQITNIVGGVAGQIILITTVSSSRDVTIVDNTNLRLSGNCVLDDTDDIAVLFTGDGSHWAQIACVNNS